MRFCHTSAQYDLRVNIMYGMSKYGVVRARSAVDNFVVVDWCCGGAAHNYSNGDLLLLRGMQCQAYVPT